MTYNSPPNSFFTLVTGKHSAGDEVAGKALNDFAELAEVEVGGVAEVEGIAAGEGENPSDSAMPHDARRALVYLLRQGSVLAAQKAKLFESLCRHELAIRKHLAAVYLQLVLDKKSGVAFVASSAYQNEHDEADAEPDAEDQAETEESTTLITRRALSLYDTLILLVLRKHYQDRESAGEQKITIDVERLESYLAPFLPITDYASKDRRKLLARVKEMVRRKVLSSIRGTEDRYEITPIIRYVVSASFLESMLAEYLQLAKSAGLAPPPLTDEDDIADD